MGVQNPAKMFFDDLEALGDESFDVYIFKNGVLAFCLYWLARYLYAILKDFWEILGPGPRGVVHWDLWNRWPGQVQVVYARDL